MEASIDLLIRQSANLSGELQVFLTAPSRQEAFAVPQPNDLVAIQQLWRTRFLRHHDPAFAWPEGAAVVRSYSERLRLVQAQWLQQPSWQPLQALLRQVPDMPLRLRLEGVDPALQALPWELQGLQRPIWRIQAADTFPPRPSWARQPRVLLVVGSEDGLTLDGEIARLQQHQSCGRIQLTLLRGPACSPAALRRALAQPSGWDAAIFLGHSSDGPSGGLLHLGDGSQIEGDSLERDWAAAATNGLRLLLLNSCSGLALASSAVRQGIDWAVCFLEPVPSQPAAIAFAAVLEGLEQGQPLSSVLSRTRNVLAHTDGCEGTELLLSAVASTTAGPFRLPLRRRRQFALRLAASHRRQLAAAASLTLLAGAMDLTQDRPINTWLLDTRLELQRHWRQVLHQPGPQPDSSHPPLPLLLLDRDTTLPALGVIPASDHTPRAALTAVLERTPTGQVPVVGFDVLLDQDRPGTEQLAATIRRQSHRRVVGGYAGPETETSQGGGNEQWLRGSPLTAAGLQMSNLAVGTAFADGKRKPVPLYLIDPISRRNFAGRLSQAAHPLLPGNSVLDWSLPWSPWIRIVSPAELPRLRAPVLLVGTGGRIGDQAVDLFVAPATVRNALQAGEQPLWNGKSYEVPGVLLQAVLIQSLNLRHWLTPLSQGFCTLAAGGLGVLLAALLERRSSRVLVVALIVLIACPLAWTLAIWPLWLVPLLLPLTALTTTAFSRPD